MWEEGCQDAGNAWGGGIQMCLVQGITVCINTGSLNEFILRLAAITKHFGSCLSHFGCGGKQGDLSFRGSTWIVGSEVGDSGSSTVRAAKRLFVFIDVPVIASQKVQTGVMGWIGPGSN